MQTSISPPYPQCFSTMRFYENFSRDPKLSKTMSKRSVAHLKKNKACQCSSTILGRRNGCYSASFLPLQECLFYGKHLCNTSRTKVQQPCLSFPPARYTHPTWRAHVCHTSSNNPHLKKVFFWPGIPVVIRSPAAIQR